MKTDRKVVSKSGSHAALDNDSRAKKAKKIVDILSSKLSLEGKKVLDIGTGSGDIAYEISKHSKSVDSVDLYDERVKKEGYKFQSVKTAELPFKDESFDVVISNHVVEHIPQQQVHVEEALRVLKSGGVLYLATPNKYWLTDPHYKLYFISWMPRKLSNKYLKKFKGDDQEWDIYPASHSMVKKFAKDSKVNKAVPIVLKMDIPKEQVGNLYYIKKVLSKLPTSLLKPVQYISPTLVYMIEKK